MSVKYKVDLHERLTELRETLGLTQVDVFMLMRQQLPRSMWVSLTTLQRYEQGPITPDVMLVAWLAHLYGVDVSDLDSDLAADLKSARDLLFDATGWMRGKAA